MKKPKSQAAEDYLRNLKEDCREIRWCVQNGRTHRVTLTRWWTKDKPLVKFFRTAELAAEFVRAERENRKADVTLKLGVNELADARTALTTLAGTGMTLQAVAEDWMARNGHRCSKRFDEVAAELLKSIAKRQASRPQARRELYVEGMRSKLRVIGRETGNKLLSEYTPKYIADWLNALPSPDRKRPCGYYGVQGYYAAFSGLFKFAKAWKYISVNPMLESGELNDIRQRKKPHAKIPYYDVEDSGRLLLAAIKNPALELAAFVPLALFAGIRHEELSRLDWAEIHLKDNYVQILSSISKNGESRRIHFGPDSKLHSLKPWLERVAQPCGPVFETWNERKRFRLLFEAANVEKTRNGFRHTAATMLVGAYADPVEARTLLGQISPRILFKHYAEDITPSEALPFFDLLPPPLTPAEEKAKRLGIMEFAPDKPAGKRHLYKNDLVRLATKAEAGMNSALASPDNFGDEDFTMG